MQQLDLDSIRHGGKRRGAGRKRAEGSRDPKHVRRQRVRHTDGVHVVLRVRRDVPRLRCRAGLLAIQHAIAAYGEAVGFRIVHFSIQHNHLHFVVEANDNLRLSKGMQAFAQSLARAINRAFGRAGEVFEHRFHSTVFTSPTQARRVIAYVLGNWRHHHEDKGRRESRTAVDPYSSAPTFDGWEEDIGVTYSTVATAEPVSWLLKEGWRKGGGALSCFAVPGPPHR